MRVLAVIPARYGSTRFPGKPLAKIAGREMILRVCDQVKLCQEVHDMVVATDDERIFACVSKAGYRAVMTKADHETGTDRLAEVAANTNHELILNVQGDEPFVNPAHLDELIRAYMSRGQDCPVATLNKPVKDLRQMHDANTVKSLVNSKGRALYFSRAPVPFLRDARAENEADWLSTCLAHIGVYLYRRDYLLGFAALPPSRMEKFEKLEQLRVLEAGDDIFCITVDGAAPGVDTPEDLLRAEQWLERR